MYTDYFDSKPKVQPTAEAVLRTLASDTSLEILAQMQDESRTNADLSRALGQSKSCIFKYLHRLEAAGVMTSGKGRPLPIQRHLVYHLARPLIAEVKEVHMQFSPESGQIKFGVVYYDDTTHDSTSDYLSTLPDLSDSRMRHFRATARNILNFFHSPRHLAMLARNATVKINSDSTAYAVESVTSEFVKNFARLEIAFVERIPIIVERNFSKPK